MVLKICNYCRREYKSNPCRNQKYCSWQCYTEIRPKKIIKRCKFCKNNFEIYPSEDKKGRSIFCSMRCRDNFFSKVRKGKNNPHWKPKIKINCVICEKEFERYPSAKIRRFCSRKCWFVYLKKIRKISPENRKNMLKSLIHNKPNKPETIMINILNKEFPDQFKYNGNFSQEVEINNLIPDFIPTNGKKLLIEVFGDYWHDPIRRKLRWNYTEQGRKEVYSKEGYETLIVWEHELKKPEDIILKIKQFIIN